MIIDFHTHVFPDGIAELTINKLEKEANSKAFTNGTLTDLKNSMQESGVDVSVVLPVVTRPRQFESINTFAKNLSKENGIISFGGIHPDTTDYQSDIQKILDYKLPGIKLHPDYQKCFVDEEKTVRIVQYAIDRGLHILFHAGVDIGLPSPVHCTPQNTSHMLEQLNYGKSGQGEIILAHTGGHLLWDEVEKYLIGKAITFDLAFNLGKIPDEQLLRMIRGHGADKFLFATDSPWDSQKEDVQYFNHFPLDKEQKDAIFGGNAQRLLSL